MRFFEAWVLIAAWFVAGSLAAWLAAQVLSPVYRGRGGDVCVCVEEAD